MKGSILRACLGAVVSSLFVSLVVPTTPAFGAHSVTIDKPVYGADQHEMIESGRFGQGWNAQRLPKTTEQAKEMGFYTQQMGWNTAGSKENHFMWVRDIEIVPPGEKPGVTSSKYYVMQDQDFVDPDKATKIAAPSRYHLGFTNSPTFRYTTELDRQEYMPKRTEVAEAVIFRGSTRYGVADKGFYYCINPNAYDPPYRQDHFLQSTRYSPQTNFQYLPELPYILQTLMTNSHIFRDGSEKDPNWELFYYAVKADWELYTANLEDTENTEKSFLDPRLTRGEVTQMIRRIVGLDGQGDYEDGEIIIKQNDINDNYNSDQNSDWMHLSKVPDGNYTSAMLLGVEYAFDHYTQGFPIYRIHNVQGQKGGMIQGTFPERTNIMRATARLLLAYTQAARKKGLLDEQLTNTPLQIEVASITDDNGNDTTNSNVAVKNVTLNLSNTDGAKSFDLVVPDSIKDKVSVVSPVGVAGTGKTTYTFDENFSQTEDQKTLTLKIASDVLENSVDLKLIKHARQSLQGSSYMPTNAYTKDPTTGHWVVHQYVTAPTNASGNYSDNQAGMSYGQQFIRFDPKDDQIPYTFSLRTNRITEKPSIHTSVSATPAATDTAQPGADGADTPVDSPEVTSTDSTEDAGATGNADAPATIELDKPAGVHVVDHVYYNNFTPGKEYRLEARLLDVTNVTPAQPAETEAETSPDDPDADEAGVESEPSEESIPEGATVVATRSVVVKAADEAGTFDVDFGYLELEPGHKYVVFEKASEYPFAGVTVRHEDPDDPAQTIVVNPKPDDPTEPETPEEPTAPPTSPTAPPTNPTGPSVTPSIPATPTQPTVPEIPATPTATVPTVPTAPNPSVPTSTPSVPVTPAQPTSVIPSVPAPSATIPVRPTASVPTAPAPTPAKPTNPVTSPAKPTAPIPSAPASTPTKPVDPTKPTKPSTPTSSTSTPMDTPSVPTTPATPATPGPSVPETPATPEVPGSPTSPENPTTPGTDRPGKPRLPQTGAGMAIPCAAIIAALVAGCVMGCRRRSG